MSDSLKFTATALIFVSVAVVVAAICYRLLYGRKPNQGQSPPSLPYAPPPIGPGSPAPSYTAPAHPQPEYPTAPDPPLKAAPANAASWSNAWAIHDEPSARKAARQAMWAAFFVAIVTGMASFLSGSGLNVVKGIGPTAWLDAVIFAGLGAGIGKMSRAAAVGALLLYIGERIAMAATAGLSPVVTIAMVSCFAQGVRGTWAFHKFRQQSPFPPVIEQRYS
jgi:hypothetical protein